MTTVRIFNKQDVRGGDEQYANMTATGWAYDNVSHVNILRGGVLQFRNAVGVLITTNLPFRITEEEE